MKLSIGVLLVVMMSGCGAHQTPEGGATARDARRLPAGHTFLSTSVTEQGRARDLAGDSRIVLEFREGEVRVDAGCNHLFGSAELRRGKLRVPGLAGTEMACEPALMAQDRWLSEFFSSSPRFVREGDRLRLTSGETTIELLDRRVAEPDRALRGTRWTVTTLVEGATASSVPRGAEPYLMFHADGRVGGNSGCNEFGARFTVDSATVTTAELVSTLRGCDDQRAEFEAAMRRVLEGEMTFSIDGDRLTLSGSDAELRLRAAE